MPNPRDPEPELAVAVNPDTGRRITEASKHHCDAIKNAAAALGDAMHEAEGSAANNIGFNEAGMQRASDHIAIGVMLALWDVRRRL